MSLNFSQAYISDNVAEINGQLVSLDNRRLYAAQMANVQSVPISRVNLSDPLPPLATGGTYGSNLNKKLNSKPKNYDVPRVQLPETGTPNRLQIVSKNKKTGGNC